MAWDRDKGPGTVGGQAIEESEGEWEDNLQILLSRESVYHWHLRFLEFMDYERKKKRKRIRIN